MTTAREKVNEFAAVLARKLDDNLLSFLLYGPVARGDDKLENVMTLLVVKDASPAALAAIEREIAEWTKRGTPPPLIFSERELQAAADVFPIEIEEMRASHVLLRGEDPLDGVTTEREDLRKALEREVRGKLLRLRTEFVAAAPNGKALGRLLTDSAATFLVLFRAVLRLVGRTPPDEPPRVVQETAAVVGLDVQAFDWVLSSAAGSKPAPLAACDPIGDRYVEQIERLAHFVDSFDTTTTTDSNKTGSGT